MCSPGRYLDDCCILVRYKHYTFWIVRTQEDGHGFPTSLRRSSKRPNYGVYGFRVRAVIGLGVGIRPSSSPRSNSYVARGLRAVSLLPGVLHGFRVRSVHSERVGRAPHPSAAASEEVRIDHGRPHAPMAQELLNGSDIGAIRERAGRKGVLEGIGQRFARSWAAWRADVVAGTDGEADGDTGLAVSPRSSTSVGIRNAHGPPTARSPHGGSVTRFRHPRYLPKFYTPVWFSCQSPIGPGEGRTHGLRDVVSCDSLRLEDGEDWGWLWSLRVQ